MKQAYSKPRMIFAVIQNTKAVADVCWANAKKSQTYYCDIPGAGFCSFLISGNNCGQAEPSSIMYYSSHSAAGIEANEIQQEALRNKVTEYVAGKKEPFSGQSTYVPTTPGDVVDLS